MTSKSISNYFSKIPKQQTQKDTQQPSQPQIQVNEQPQQQQQQQQQQQVNDDLEDLKNTLKKNEKSRTEMFSFIQQQIHFSKNDKENSSPTSQCENSVSSSVPIAQLISSKLVDIPNGLLTDDDSSENSDNLSSLKKPQLTPKSANEPVSTNTKHQTTPQTNFVFSSATSGRNSTFTVESPQQQQHTTPNSVTKRKLNLTNLIDQIPDTEFVKITTSPANSANTPKNKFKTPLTEHQKEIKREKPFIPLEISDNCVELTSSSSILDPNQSMSCTFDAYEHHQQSQIKQVQSPDTIEDTVQLPEHETLSASQKIDDCKRESLWRSKKLRIEETCSLVNNSKIQFHSKIKPNKHIEIIEIQNSEEAKKFEGEVKVVVVENQQITTEVAVVQDKPQVPVEAVAVESKQLEEVVVEANKSEVTAETVNAVHAENENKMEIEEVDLNVEVEKKVEIAVEVEDGKTVEEVKKDEAAEETTENTRNKRRSTRLKALKVLAKPDESEPLPEDAPKPFETVVDVPKKATEAKVSSSNSTVESTSSIETEVEKPVTRKRQRGITVSVITDSPIAVVEEVTDEALISSVATQETSVVENVKEIKEVKKEKKKIPRRASLLVTTSKEENILKPNLSKSGKVIKLRSRSVNNSPNGASVGTAITKLDKDSVKQLKNGTRYKRLLNLNENSLQDDKGDGVKGEKMKVDEAKDEIDEEDIPISQLIVNRKVSTRRSRSSISELPSGKVEAHTEAPAKKVAIAEEEEVVVPKPLVVEDVKVDQTQVAVIVATTKPVLDTINENEADKAKESQNVETNAIVVDAADDTVNFAPVVEEPVSLNNIQFTRAPLTPTASILKKRRSINITSLDFSNPNAADNLTPSKRRVSFCESVQIEEIEPNENKSIFRTTPRITNRAKLVLSPYFNKAPQAPQPAVQSNAMTTATSSANANGLATTGNANSAVLSNKASLGSVNVQSKFPATNQSQSPQASNNNNVQTSPGNSLISFFSANKQSFLSQRSTIIQQQMQQHQQNRGDCPSSPQITSSIITPTSTTATPDTSASSLEVTLKPANKPSTNEMDTTTNSDITNVTILSEPSEAIQIIGIDQTKTEALKPKENEKTPVYAALKDCLLNVDLIAYDIASPMWSTGIVQLLKSKSILTIGDLCSLSINDINELPFKAPKLEHFLKFIQKFHKSLEGKEHEDETPKQVQTGKNMGSLEEEMAKLEEAQNSLDTSIECENRGDDIENEDEEVSTTQKARGDVEMLVEHVEKAKSLDEITRDLLQSLTSDTFNRSSFDDQLMKLNTGDQIKLLNYVNKVNIRLFEINSCILHKINIKS